MSDEPHWLLIYLSTIARETGWSSHFILWELPMVQGLGILHVAGIHHGRTMRWVNRRAGKRSEEKEVAGGGMFERWRKIKGRVKEES